MDEQFRIGFLNYFRCGQLSTLDKVLSFISPHFLFKKNAGVISASYKKLAKHPSGIIQKTVSVENYSGSNPVAKKISQVLKAKAGDMLAGAYVHGSIGTSEEIPYSDFDGLVIVKSACIESPQDLFKTVLALKEAEQMMLEMDPLQHHGWFVLSETDLADYPEYYFPYILFNHAKCLFGENILQIQLREEGYMRQFRQSFHRLSESIFRKLESKSFLENRYVFKNLLSEFMLLPAVYLQAKTGKGVFKKISFEMVANEVGASFDVMKEISSIRRQWDNNVPVIYRDKQKAGNPLSADRSVKSLSGRLPEGLKNIFDDAMVKRMKDFVLELKNRLQE